MLHKTISFIFSIITSINPGSLLAHSGLHNDHYHPVNGVDYFFIFLLIGLVTGAMAYYRYKQ